MEARQDETMASLYLSRRGDLVNYADGIVHDRAHAEDVVQEAWLRLDSAAAKRPLDEPLAYLYRIIRNLAADYRRKIKRQVWIAADSEPAYANTPDERLSPEAELLAEEELRILKKAMSELPERTRIALEMRRFGNCKLKEIAAQLNVSVSVAHEIVASGIAYCRGRVRPDP